ncbi:MAG: hypothetical protein IV110_02980 [Aquabacterium sp.]|uniref:hypothetical protein n=1 Tax=Aquabacterium sp. TaxID=1872578 RepID=UPI001DDAD5FA|nr:hypothetical protein [Aquabacterium sp.]MBT9608989.1 hypothetical protein [Aquabacterium sp.]
MKKIVLPPTEGGYYRFGELPQLIAEALHPDELYPDDYIKAVVIWRDDGSEHGLYIKCTPPAGSRESNLDRHAEWVQTPIELTDEEKLHPDRCKWVHWRWDEQRKPVEEQAYWPDGGGLIVWDDSTQERFHQVLSIKGERDWYKDQMREDATRGTDDPRRLVVVDGNLNGLTYTRGAALDRGWVHIDKLNQWGAMLDTVNVFSVAEVAPHGASQQETHKALIQRQSPTVKEAISGYVEKVMSANPRFTAEDLHRYMKRHAGDDDSPFSRVNPGEDLYCVDADAPCGIASVRAALTQYRKNKAKTEPSTVEVPWKR